MIGYLVLENGMIFSGERIGYQCDKIFEVVFNTSMSGYIEVLTDPSYTGQGIVFTYPLIGNYGVMREDVESAKIWVSAIFVHELADFASNFRKGINLNDFLIEHKIPGLQNVNTRALTKILRETGVMMGKICDDATDAEKIVTEIKQYHPTLPVDLVTTKSIQTIGNGKYHIALLDFGVKGNIVKSLLSRDTKITLFPSESSYEDIMKIKPHGIVLSNGPGDPKDNVKAIQTIKKLYESSTPILGICLGHQLLALATGADTKKLKYGHRGPNHPVKDLQSNRIYISSQNHGYYIDESTLDPKVSYVTFRNVNDKTVEGLKYHNKQIATVQFHPEACAGPLDTNYLFDDFINILKGENHA
ncbi:MAG: carbamoyl phosphate synthase small subunit [Mycoplasmataceae bacterium]|nr:carbamoyl phosphate synthase small subunit [Mycoplasmataceae bacterium]